MAQKFYKKFSWVPSSPKDKMEKPVHRRCCCDVTGICRRLAPSVDCYPDRASVQEYVRRLEEFLADGGCARDPPISCRCGEWLQDPCSLAVVLLSRRLAEERRLRGALRSPFPLLRTLFLRLDTMRHWHKMLTADPWIPDLLEVCSAVLAPRPRGMRVPCRERLVSEVSAGRRQRPSDGQTVGRRSAGHKQTMDLFGYHQPGPDFPGAEEQSDQSRELGLLASIQQLKNSLKKDLETHQLYLGAIETRLSGLERRAQDVTKHLERANLELEAIKHGSVTLETMVDEEMSSSVTEDLEEAEERLWWSERPVLIQQITQQINQMESDIKITSKQRQSAG